jgi:hypothetical protein
VTARLATIGRIAALTAATAAMSWIVLAPAASAAPKPSAGTAVTASVPTPDVLREDKQTEETNTVAFTGIDAKTVARVSFGDGTETQTERGTCKVETAIAHPEWCAISFTHHYDAPGTYTITAIAARTTISKVVTITSKPVFWTPPAGWAQPAGWTVLWQRGATYHPCQEVTWFFDRTGEAADRTTMIDDVRTSLSMLSAETGLTFTEAAEPSTAMLTFAWGDLTGRGPNVAGVGGPQGIAKAGVVFSIHSAWTTNARGGVITNWYGRGSAGRVWLVVHEVMHGLGVGHVEDAGQVMHAQGGAMAFGSGDLDALHTMYRNNSCPVG